MDNIYLSAIGMSANNNSDGSYSITSALGDNLISFDPPTPSTGATAGLDFNFYIGDTQASFSVPLAQPAAGQTLTYGSTTITQTSTGAIVATAPAAAGGMYTITAQPYSNGAIGLSNADGIFHIMSAQAVQNLVGTAVSTDSNKRQAQDWYTGLCIALITLVAAEVMLMIYALWEAWASISYGLAELAALEAELALLEAQLARCIPGLVAGLESEIFAIQFTIAILKAAIKSLQQQAATLIGLILVVIEPFTSNVKDCVKYLLNGQVAPAQAAGLAAFAAPDGSLTVGAIAGPAGTMIFPALVSAD